MQARHFRAHVRAGGGVVNEYEPPLAHDADLAPYLGGSPWVVAGVVGGAVALGGLILWGLVALAQGSPASRR